MRSIIIIRRMGKTLSVFLFLILSLALSAQDYTLVWSDEFDYDGLPDPVYWSYEVGYIRNNESQYYTSASLITKGKKEFTYGRFEIRAKKFHVWRMDWDEHTINLYQDNVLCTTEDISTNDIT